MATDARCAVTVLPVEPGTLFWAYKSRMFLFFYEHFARVSERSYSFKKGLPSSTQLFSRLANIVLLAKALHAFKLDPISAQGLTEPPLTVTDAEVLELRDFGAFELRPSL